MKKYSIVFEKIGVGGLRKEEAIQIMSNREKAYQLLDFVPEYKIGYVVAYGAAGTAADGISACLDLGVGRGAAIAVIISGVLLSVTALLLYPLKSVRALEETRCYKK